MAIDRSRKRTRLAMVVVRSPTSQSVDEALLEDQRRVQMDRQMGDSRQIVVMASPEEVRASHAARQTPPSPSRVRTSPSVAAETQRRLLAHAHRARHFLSDRSVADHLSQTRRGEMLRELWRLKDEIKALQDQIEVTTRSVESMERLASHLKRLARDFVPRGVRGIRERSAVHEVEAAGASQPEDEHEDT